MAATSIALAQNATRGKQLYENTNNAPLTCSTAGVCHGLDPTLNINKIKNGSNPATIASAIQGVSTMKFLSTYITTSTDRADLAAYIANPAAATGGGGTAALSASGTSLTFGAIQVGMTNSSPSPASITLTNAGTASVIITAVNKSGTNAAEFNPTGSCVSASPVTLAPNVTCTLGASFTPSASGKRTATFTVASNAAANPAITVSGDGSSVAVASIALNRTSVAFPTQTISTTSPAQSITVTNSGSAPLTVTNVATTPTPEFVSTSGCTTVIPSGTCSITVVFTPAAAGTRSGNVTITTNVGVSSVTLTGNAVLTPTPIAAADKTAVDFPATRVGSSGTSSFTVTNIGNAPMQISNVAVGGTDASEFNMASTSTCQSGTLEAQKSCKIDLLFEPQSAGAKTATVMVSHNASGGATSVAASGSGMATPTSSALAPSNIGGIGALSPTQLIALALSLVLVPTLRRRLARQR